MVMTRKIIMSLSAQMMMETPVMIVHLEPIIQVMMAGTMMGMVFVMMVMMTVIMMVYQLMKI